MEYYGDRIIDKTEAITRTNVEFMDEKLGWQLPVLDKGFIRIIDYMGDDLAIEQAARLSYGAGTRTVSETQGLLNYLMGHRHTSPFEMCEIKIHVKLPILAMRQWIRHRMANVNEYSARYSVLSDEFYIPAFEDIMHQSTDNKQGRSGLIDTYLSSDIRRKLTEHSEVSYDLYRWLISDDVDFARELARMTLPVNIYTEMYWKIDLHNLFHFLSLRADPHAQKEIRVYGEMLEWIIMGWVPMAWNAFKTYRKDAITFSAHEALLIRAALAMPKLDPETKPTWANALSKREWKAFLVKLKQIT